MRYAKPNNGEQYRYATARIVKERLEDYSIEVSYACHEDEWRA
jgi:hypothetical protein